MVDRARRRGTTASGRLPVHDRDRPHGRDDADPEHARLVEGLREIERTLAEAQRIARIGSWTLDPATGDATWSPEMFRILGVAPESGPVPLSQISRLFTPESVDAVTAAIAASTTSGEPWTVELEYVRPDGSRGLVVSNGVIESGADGSVRRIWGTMQDVTEQRRLEGDLRQAQRLEAVGQLAGGIAHDFNNLLTVIRGYAALAADDILVAPEEARADLAEVVAAADRAAELVRQLLAFSRRQVLRPRVVDPSTIVASLSPMLRRLLGEHIELRTPAAAPLGRVLVDPSQLEQVIVNLAVNARDAMPRGGRLTIETSDVELDETYVAGHPEVSPGPYVALMVSDTGTGIDPVTLRHIFEPFFTTKEAGKGTGMGLATVYGIVKQSAGSIHVYSEVGHGTSFKVYLPRVAAEADAAVNPASDGLAGGGSETILLVEDDEPVRSLASRILAARGYAVLEAANGPEALALARTHAGRIDLLITDVIMPGMQGHELVAALGADIPQVRTLYVSGFTDDSVGHHAEVGAHFLAKPFTGESLARAVRRALDAPT